MKHKYLFMMALCAGMLAGCKHDSITPEKPKTDEEVIPGAGKLEEFSTPGIYKTESKDLVSPLRVYSQDSDQQSIVSKSSSTGYRVMNLQEGQMLSICVGSKTFSENKSYSVNVSHLGSKDSKASTIPMSASSGRTGRISISQMTTNHMSI